MTYRDIKPANVTIHTTADRLERWRRRAAELGCSVEGWLELLADNAIALADVSPDDDLPITDIDETPIKRYQ